MATSLAAIASKKAEDLASFRDLLFSWHACGIFRDDLTKAIEHPIPFVGLHSLPCGL